MMIRSQFSAWNATLIATDPVTCPITSASASGLDRTRSEQLAGSWGAMRYLVGFTGTNKWRSLVFAIIHACSAGAALGRMTRSHATSPEVSASTICVVFREVVLNSRGTRWWFWFGFGIWFWFWF